MNSLYQVHAIIKTSRKYIMQSNSTWISLAYDSFMPPRAVSDFLRVMKDFVSHDCMFVDRRIRTYKNTLWGVRSVSQSNTRFYRGNINGSWKQIRSIVGSFFGLELSSIVMGGRFKYGLPGKGFLNH